MLVKQPKYRKTLSSNQIGILKTIFKFRFVSTGLLAEYFNKDKSSIYENLYVLQQQAYITKRYDKTYRLAGKPATYCLAPKGIRSLAGHITHPTILKNMYKNKTASEALISRSLLTMQTYLKLKQQYTNNFHIVSRYELNPDALSIRPLPDLYLQRQARQSRQPSYLLEFLEPSVMSWILRKRIRAYETDSEAYISQFPSVLLVTTNDSTERRLQSMLEDGYQDFDFYTTTTERLNREDTKIWREPGKLDEAERPSLCQL